MQCSVSVLCCAAHPKGTYIYICVFQIMLYTYIYIYIYICYIPKKRVSHNTTIYIYIYIYDWLAGCKLVSNVIVDHCLLCVFIDSVIIIIVLVHIWIEYAKIETNKNKHWYQLPSQFSKLFNFFFSLYYILYIYSYIYIYGGNKISQ